MSVQTLKRQSGLCYDRYHAWVVPSSIKAKFAFENVFQREEGKILVAGIIHHSFVTAFAIVTPAGGSNNGALFPFRDPAQLFLSGLDIYQCFLFSLQRTLSQCPPVCLCIQLTLGLVFTTFHMLELFRLGEDQIEGLKRMKNCLLSIHAHYLSLLKFVCYKNEVVLWLPSEYSQLGQASFDVPLE